MDDLFGKFVVFKKVAYTDKYPKISKQSTLYSVNGGYKM